MKLNKSIDVNSLDSRKYNDLKELHEAIFSCRKCKEIGEKITNIQPAWDHFRGHPTINKWGMWIGQAPGKKEAVSALGLKSSLIFQKKDDLERKKSKRIAFVGDSGKRFLEWLKGSGWSDEECDTLLYKTSITKCYPGSLPFSQYKYDRQPSKKEIMLCSHFLREQIRLVKPKVLIPMGSLAVQWFCKNSKLDDVIGKENLMWDGIHVVCFPHASQSNRWLNNVNNRLKLEKAKEILFKLKGAIK